MWVTPDGGVNWTNITAQFYDAACKPKAGVKGDLIPCDKWVKRVVASAFDQNTAYVGFSGYRTHNEDKTYLFVTKDLGKTWTNISGGLNTPIFDVEEDPDNANVLYLSGDGGIQVTIDQGKTWTAFSTSAPDTVIRDMAIQKRDREMAIGTYGRGFYVVDIGPIKEFTPAVFDEAAHLFDVKTTINWSRFERRGDTLGEMAKADNPPVGPEHLLLPEGRRPEGHGHDQGPRGQRDRGTLAEFAEALRPSVKKGLQKVFWGLNRDRGGRAGGRRAARRGRWRRQRGGGGAMVDAGVYKVTLTVDGKDVATKRIDSQPGSDVQVARVSDPRLVGS